jgi:hypothetical protein
MDHPVVSTVLYFLGHKQRAAREEESRSNNTLSWKDDHGGKIAEYLSEVQQKTPVPASSKETTLLTQAELSSNSRNSNVPTNQNVVVSEMRRNGLPGDESPFTPSPQWGQYVPITPPIEQDMYTKSKVQQIGKPQLPINIKS